ncbi:MULTISPECIES: hypothetical protein [unclassified Streptomyces]|uniref:hypothetical protein n=1 Tax=unclassified Streptomyces TaxID=2593676 RepID=UPI001BEB1757|nr:MULTISPECIES: hypothetical protein [unclassified Streptomyces]MBT2407650.1 hypothetical protein [Streptomyces sp. ISL-21]MBT2457163.1 hypothetical protein [Streptomyces sp. ISL-86]MBT2607956.1 hypothetical protein [Streptomyces sp. ISL-87]
MRYGGNGRGRLAASLGVFATALVFCAGGLLMAPPAQAAAGACEGRLVTSLPFSTGELRVYKSRTRACAMTVAARPGTRRFMSVSIQPRGGVPVRDSGQFSRYAGPVSVAAISRCVYVKGSVGAGSAESGWILC